MSTHYLNPGERRYFWWPFWGLPTGATPDIQVGDGAWKAMVADDAFSPAQPVSPAGAKWFRAFLAHPTAPAHEQATVVPPGTSPIRHRVTGNPEIEIPTRNENVVAR